MSLTGPQETPRQVGPASSRGAALTRFLPLVIGGGLLALILSRVDLTALAGVLARAHWPWYGAALLLLLLNLLIISGRWRYNLGLLGLRYPYWHLFLIDNAGALAGAATPSRMGDLARLVYFRQDRPVLVRVGLSIMVERLLDLTVLVGLGLAFLWTFPLPPVLKRGWAIAMVAAAALGLGVVLTGWFVGGRLRLLEQLSRWIPRSWQERFAGSGQEVQATLQAYATWRLAAAVALTVLAWWVNILSAYCSALALELPLSLWQSGALFCLSTLFSLIPVSVAGIGTRDLALIYLFSCLGLPAEQALAFSFLLLGFLVAHSCLGFVALLSRPPQARPAASGGVQRERLP